MISVRFLQESKKRKRKEKKRRKIVRNMERKLPIVFNT